MMSEPALKCENYTIFKQNYILNLFITIKMAYFCNFSLGGNLDFPDFLQKNFYNIDYRAISAAFDPQPQTKTFLSKRGIDQSKISKLSKKK